MFKLKALQRGCLTCRLTGLQDSKVARPNVSCFRKIRFAKLNGPTDAVESSEMRASLLAACMIVACLGCTTQSLDRKTLELAESSSDLRYREVLENLAMVENNRWALPSYSSFYAGTSDLSDAAMVDTPLVPYRSSALKPLFAGTLDASASRAVKDNWTLDPVVVPEKLLAMRCACWCVLDHCIYPDCGRSVYLVHYSSVTAHKSPPGYYFGVEGYLQKSLEGSWLCNGGGKGAVYEATCRGTRVYVTKNGIDGLSEFAIALESIARVDFSTIYFPKPVSRTIKLTQRLVAVKEASCGEAKPDDVPRVATDALRINSISITVDENGWVTPGVGKYSALNPDQPKVRVDNVGVNADLRSAISNAKSP